MLYHMRAKQSGPVQPEFYIFSLVWSVWSGPKIIHNSFVAGTASTLVFFDRHSRRAMLIWPRPSILLMASVI